MRMEPEVHKAPHIVYNYRVSCIRDVLGFSHDWSVRMKLGDGHVDSRGGDPRDYMRLYEEGRKTWFLMHLGVLGKGYYLVAH